MNKVYRLIWSAVRQCWIVAAEKVTAKGGIPARTVGALSVAALVACGTAAHALPTGNSLAAGQATVSTPTAGQMQITQTSNRAVINWNSFGIATGESVNISQPSSSSALLNRVIGNSSSEIYGSLTANGQVFLINPNGVLFGKSASVNVGGLVASSLNITDTDFMNNNLKFFKDGSAGSVVNQGTITAGFAALLGPTVDNSGSIITYKGSTVLAGADAVTLNFDTSGLIALTLDQGAYNAQVQNSGIIEADGGRVILSAKSADSILKSMVNNSGIIRARSVDTSNGQILLLGDRDNGTVSVGGTLDATGGSIETSAHDVTFQSGALVKAKNWLIDPVDITINDAAASAIASALSADGSSVTEQADNSITVTSPVTWTSTGTLILNAGTNIAINANISATNGTLKLLYGQSSGDGSGYDYSLGSGAKVNLSMGNHFSTQQGSSGTEIPWYVITLASNALSDFAYSGNYTLLGLTNSSMLSGHYVLGADITITTSNFLGTAYGPIGTSSTSPFSGGFDGLGHTINDYPFNAIRDWGAYSYTDYVGPFGYNTGVIRNVGLVNGSVTGGSYVGGLVGYNSGSISNCYVTTTGSITGSGSYVGGLVGYNSGSISNSYATASVTGGISVTSDLYNSSVTGSVSYLGGLVGYTSGSISNSYATGNVTGSVTTANVRNSSSVTGSVSYLGGLAGYTSGSISNSSATGNVTGSVTTAIVGGSSVTGSFNYLGGLVGDNASSGSISNSSATGNVTGSVTTGTVDGTVTSSLNYLGGLVGYNNAGSISDSYATGSAGSVSVTTGTVYSGSVTGSAANVGGLVGYNNTGSISDSYATGNVSGSSNAGGLVGYNDSGTISNSFYDIDGVGNLLGPNGIYDSQFQAWLTNGKNSLSIGAYFTQEGDGYYELGSIQNLKDLLYFSGNSAYSFRLTNNIDLSPLAATNWYIQALSGTLDGNNHTLSNLTVSQAGNDIGLVGYLASGASIKNLGLTNVTVSGGSYVGGLVGQSNGSISNVSVGTGSVTGSGSYVGGLAGYNNTGAISTSSATASVTGSGDYVGGLVGYTSGSISTSYATGGVTGSGVNYVGGLAGYTSGNISSSYATGSVTGGYYVGGLVGYTSGSISDSYATGSVVANGTVGSNSYVGGLAGYNVSGSISTSYATGSVSGSTNVGGLVGGNIFSQSIISNSFFDTETTGRSSACGTNNGTCGATGLSTADMKSYSTYSSLWNISDTSGSSATWRIYDGYSYPLLRSFLTPLTVTAGSATATYNGTTSFSGSEISGISYSVPTFNSSAVTYTADSKNVGSRALSANGLYSDQQGYDISFTGGTVTITAKTLTLTAPDVSKTYDGGLTYTATAADLTSLGSALFGTDTVTAATISYANKNAGTNKTVTLGSATINDGNSGNNYSITLAGNSTSTILQKAVTLTAPDVSKTYDGGLTYTTTAANLASLGSVLVAGDTVTAATISYADKNAGSGTKTVTLGSATINDGNSGNNYSITLAGNSASTILQKAVTLTAPSVSKTYDGGQTYTTTAADLTSLGSALVAGDTVTAATISYADKNAGTNKAVTLDSASINDGNSGNNYSITLLAGNSASTILQKALTLSGITAANKTYDGTNAATLDTAGATVTGKVTGDTVTLAGTGSGSFADKNAGTGKTVTVSGYTLGGADAGNYSVGQPVGLTADITAKPVTLTAPDVSKTYDGGLTYTATAANLASLGSALVAGDTVTAAAINYADKNAGTNKTVTLGSATISDGNSGNNYSITLAGNSASTILQKAVTLTAPTVSKTYDGGVTYTTTAADLTSLGSALVGTDTVTAATISYGDKNAGTNKTVSLDGATIDDGNSGNNYSITLAGNNTSTILQKALTLSGITAANKIYDGTNAATVSGGSLSGVISGDSVTLGQSGTFSDKNVGTGKTVSYTDSLSGTDSGNYVLASSTGTTTASITPAALTVTANNAGKTYDGSAYSGGNGVSYSGLVGGETAAVLSGSLTYGGASQGAVNTGSYSIIPSGLSSGNYTISYQNGSLTIRPVNNLDDQLVPLLASLSPSSGPLSPSDLLKLQIAEDARGGETNSVPGSGPNGLISIIDGGVRW